jgi:aminoglycoside phosphotransferase (APT) family kinase protein
VPVIAGYAGGWKDGHAEYRNFLWSSLDKLALAQESRKILSEAFAYLDAASGALAYEHGAVLLHNDFHPKNIIVSDGAFSGLIDWECSQYGEPDFELCHLVHWCRYPPEPGIDLKPLLRSLFQASPACARTPDLIDRLTIYQIEHEMAQLHWSRGSAERDRIPRLRAWLDREVDAVLGGL